MPSEAISSKEELGKSFVQQGKTENENVPVRKRLTMQSCEIDQQINISESPKPIAQVHQSAGAPVVSVSFETGRKGLQPFRDGVMTKFANQTCAEERERVLALEKEDPITVQEIVVTSRAFVDACSSGDTAEAKRIVNDAEDDELLQAYCYIAFEKALRNAHFEIIKLFILEWGLPLQDHEMGLKACHICVEAVSATPSSFRNIIEILRLFFSGHFGISVDTPRPKDGWTALCAACAAGEVAVACKLIQGGANVNSITRDNETPLSLANRAASGAEGNVLINVLKKEGALVDPKDIMKKLREKPAPIEYSSFSGTAI